MTSNQNFLLVLYFGDFLQQITTPFQKNGFHVIYKFFNIFPIIFIITNNLTFASRELVHK